MPGLTTCLIVWTLTPHAPCNPQAILNNHRHCAIKVCPKPVKSGKGKR